MGYTNSDLVICFALFPIYLLNCTGSVACVESSV